MTPRRWSEEELRQAEEEVGLREVSSVGRSPSLRGTPEGPASLKERLSWMALGMFIVGLFASAVTAKTGQPVWRSPSWHEALFLVLCGPGLIGVCAAAAYALYAFMRWVVTGR